MKHFQFKLCNFNEWMIELYYFSLLFLLWNVINSKRTEMWFTVLVNKNLMSVAKLYQIILMASLSSIWILQECMETVITYQL